MRKKSKDRLRKELARLRDRLSTRTRENLSSLIVKRSIDFIETNEGKTVHIFLSIKSEVDTGKLIDYCIQKNITMVCPKVISKTEMLHIELKSLSDLEEGPFNTKHPKGENNYPGKYDIIFVPGLGFDLAGNRLGYGAGYYDTFLKDHPYAKTIALAFNIQLLNEIPSEEHDITVDYIITESELIRTGNNRPG